VTARTGQVVVGYGITATDLRSERKIPLTLRAPARLYLDLSFRLAMDQTDNSLMVTSSFVGILLAEQTADGVVFRELLHYDFERDKDL
jgi:hypothetical protein